MLFVVLPLTVAGLAAIDVIPVKIVVIIYVDVTAAPVAIPPPVVSDAGTNQDTRAEGESHSGVVTGIGIWVVRIRGRPVDYCWIVRGNVNDLGIGLFHHDY